MSSKAQFITDQNGERTAVVLPMSEYENLLEDLEDLAAVAERANEPTISLEEVVAKLKKDGYLPR